MHAFDRQTDRQTHVDRKLETCAYAFVVAWQNEHFAKASLFADHVYDTFHRATVYTATHGISKAFLSVRLPFKRVHCDKTKEICAHFLIPHKRTIIRFSDTKNGWWRRPLIPEIFSQTDLV